MLPCESDWNRAPPLTRNLHRERCIPKYRLKLCGDENDHLYRGDLARKSIDIRKVFGVSGGHAGPIWPLTGTDALCIRTEGLY